MPDFITKNLSAFITIAIITMGGVVSFTRIESKVSALETRVDKLEESNTDIRDTLNRIDKRLSLILCKMDSSTCLEKP